MSSGSKEPSKDNKGKRKATVESDNEHDNEDSNAAPSSSTGPKSPPSANDGQPNKKQRTPTPEPRVLPNLGALLQAYLPLIARPKNVITSPIFLRCNKCDVEEKQAKEFTKCLRCKAVAYCGKKCQKDDHKEHKKACGELANKIGKIVDENLAKRLETVAVMDAVNKEIFEGVTVDGIRYMNNNVKLDGIYEFWIDVFRLWASDGYPGRDDNCTETDLFTQFKQFLDKLRALPSFWAPWLENRTNKLDCVAKARENMSLMTLEELLEKYQLNHGIRGCISHAYRDSARLVVNYIPE